MVPSSGRRGPECPVHPCQHPLSNLSENLGGYEDSWLSDARPRSKVTLLLHSGNTCAQHLPLLHCSTRPALRTPALLAADAFAAALGALPADDVACVRALAVARFKALVLVLNQVTFVLHRVGQTIRDTVADASSLEVGIVLRRAE
jgi:hypothetical protein